MVIGLNIGHKLHFPRLVPVSSDWYPIGESPVLFLSAAIRQKQQKHARYTLKKFVENSTWKN